LAPVTVTRYVFGELTVFVAFVPPIFQLYPVPPLAISGMEVVAQVSVPVAGAITAVGGIVSLVTTEEAEAVQPLASVIVTL
jgi:hypothetical protein